MIKWFLNLLGRDSIFDIRPKKTVGPWVVVGLGAGEVTRLRDLIHEVYSQSDEKTRYHQFIGYQFRLIALSVRSKSGFPLFNPDKTKDLIKVSAYPQAVIDETMEVICEISGLDWLKPSKKSESETSDTVAVNKEPLPDVLPEGSVPEDFDDGLDFSDEKEEGTSSENPSKACVTADSSTD